MNLQHRKAITLIEVLVVAAIVGLLLALLIPAVQSVRESSRRVSCQANMANMGKGLHSYEAARRQLPPLTEFHPNRNGRALSGHSPHVRLLPFLDETLVFRRFDLTGRVPNYWIPTYELGPKVMPRLPVFLCPSDSPVDGRPGNNYRWCTGPGLYDREGAPHLADGGLGAFLILKTVRLSSIADGLSQTVALSEKLMGGQNVDSFDRRRDLWFSGFHPLMGRFPSTDESIRVCGALPRGSQPRFNPYAGATWQFSAYEQTLYNHAVGPNFLISDCSPYAIGIDQPANGGVFRATSLHPAGVNVLLLDGGVKFVGDSIDLAVWRSLATRTGKEPIPDKW